MSALHLQDAAHARWHSYAYVGNVVRIAPSRSIILEVLEFFKSNVHIKEHFETSDTCEASFCCKAYNVYNACTQCSYSF